MKNDAVDQQKFSRRELIIGAALAGIPATSASFASSCSTLAAPTGTLRARAERKGLLVGTTIDAAQFHDAAYIAAISADSNVLVPENGFNWTRTQPRQGMPLDFCQVSPAYQIAKRIGAKMRLHNLVYDLTTPAWVKELIPTLSPAAAEKILTNYIEQVLGVWGDKVAHIEVVNEPGYDLGTTYRPFVFSQKLGMHYLDAAFHAAHRAAPHALLFTNAGALEHHERIFTLFRDGMLNLLEGMVSRGVPIHALGIEAHLLTDRAFLQSDVEIFLQRVTDLGLKFMITEFDVNDRGIAGNIAERDAGSAALGKAFLDVAFSFPQCLGIVSWNGSDRYTWLHSDSDEGDAPVKRQRADHAALRPTPLDENLRRKPLWSAIASAIDGAPKR